jgi:adenosylhomocysteine nucleosidase/adenosylhomocysteine/aminodeoxyfutalosine nucleosidase
MYSKGLTLIDMESAPIAYICKVNNVECIIIKGISDFPSNYAFNDSEQFQEYVRNVPVVLEKICSEYLEKFI